MAVQNFEKYFLHFPELDREKDFFKFWERAIGEIKKIPVKPESHENHKRSSEKFTAHHITYQGFQKTLASCELLVPVKAKKPLVIIHIHDYNNKFKYRLDALDSGFAHLFVTLRGHANLPARDEKELRSPGYMAEHILDIETYYAKGAYLDIYRSIDLVRLNTDLDCSRIGIIGKGFGAAAAVFTASYSDRVSALALETPAFCHLKLGQNISTSEITAEINKYIDSKPAKKKLIKTQLSYFDGINFSDMIHCPVLSTVGLKDTLSPPECIFAFFNHLETDKTIEVYPDEGNSAGGSQQAKKTMAWMAEKLHGASK